MAFTGSWHLNSIGCFQNPPIFQCSSACFSTQNAAHPEKLWSIHITLGSLSLPFQSLLAVSIDIRGQSSISLLLLSFFQGPSCKVRSCQHFGRRRVEVGRGVQNKMMLFPFQKLVQPANIFPQISHLHDLCVPGYTV